MNTLSQKIILYSSFFLRWFVKNKRTTTRSSLYGQQNTGSGSGRFTLSLASDLIYPSLIPLGVASLLVWIPNRGYSLWLHRCCSSLVPTYSLLWRGRPLPCLQGPLRWLPRYIHAVMISCPQHHPNCWSLFYLFIIIISRVQLSMILALCKGLSSDTPLHWHPRPNFLHSCRFS